MSKVLLRRRLDGSLAAMDEQAADALKRVKANTDVWCEIKVARNPRHHRLFFALVSMTWKNLPEKYERAYPTLDKFRKAVEMEAGHYDEIIGIDGAVYRIPKSIAFSEMEQTEFDRLFPRVMRICADVLRMDSSDLADELEKHAA